MTPVEAMSRLTNAMAEPAIAAANVIPWACPVPYFGRIAESVVATVGINPSNLEFVDLAGTPLSLNDRRLPTLGSMGLDRWAGATPSMAERLLTGCSDYFEQNPYRSWFDPLDRMLTPSGYSYYAGPLVGGTACHLDIVPYVTNTKWGLLSSAQRSALTAMGLEAMAHFLRASPATLLLLNGASVVSLLSPHVGRMAPKPMPAWNLPQKAKVVRGMAYLGETRQLAGIDLGRVVQLLGWNHNIQSSFGVTTIVKNAIASWIAREGSQ